MSERRWIEELLFDTTASDPTIFGAVALALIAVAALASAAPAVRGARVDPLNAVRTE